MRQLSPTTAVLIAAALAVLLIGYVFMGGGSQQANAQTRCTSQQALDQVKTELFRRAAAMRGSDQSAFVQVAGYTVLRPASRLQRRTQSNRVHCSGPLALDLPPGIEAVGGRSSLTANLSYALDSADNGSARLRALDNAEPLVALLSTLTQTGSATGALLLPPAMQAQQTAAAPPPNDQPAPAPAADERETQVAARPPAPPPKTAQVKQPAAPPRRAAAKAPDPPKKVQTAPAPPRYTARPSFNCRNARTRGEIAVCSDDELASLDRQMAAQFYRAVAAAGPGERALLQRTRSRFLGYRDSCGTRACMVEAYQGRMREIADIMAGRWRPN